MLFFYTIFHKTIAKNKNFLYLCTLNSIRHANGLFISSSR